eukprot:NODE_4534_length_664_cov_192.047619.p1 GENE.NODE_4534_length_664_cov_192.047619~~NODE_4534_length_664_cov_192.047619.p1  ORF type:complete len:211 (+),score=77.51 NODE_4534_length_664_cov_192.047619:86-634(+)
MATNVKWRPYTEAVAALPSRRDELVMAAMAASAALSGGVGQLVTILNRGGLFARPLPTRASDALMTCGMRSGGTQAALLHPPPPPRAATAPPSAVRAVNDAPRGRLVELSGELRRGPGGLHLLVTSQLSQPLSANSPACALWHSALEDHSMPSDLPSGDAGAAARASVAASARSSRRSRMPM